jgi:hypothetical protein
MVSQSVIPASISGIAAIIAAVIGFLNKLKLGEVHVLVNSRLDEALKLIEILKAEKAERDKGDNAPAV